MQKEEGIYHRAFFTRRSNEHETPNRADNGNVLPAMDKTKFSTRIVQPVKFATDAAESAAAKVDFAYELWNEKKLSQSLLSGKPYQASFDEFTRTDVPGDAAVKHSFSYTFNNPMIEHLQTIGFYPTDVPMKNDKGGYEFEEL